MEFLTNWIANIILFVLFAVIIDLLLPNSSFQRYTKMVIGLLLIAIILNPILKIFDEDLEQLLKTMQLPNVEDKKQIENLIENKKNEIQASQRAYILEQMAVQMEEMVEEELMKNFGYQVETIHFHFLEPGDEISTENLKKVEVIVREVQNSEELAKNIPVVKEIKIDTSLPIPKENKTDATSISAFLADRWQLNREIVMVVMEGGKM
ncbi:stage III sporulation protein AF [Calidifontibacillus erzurumensis]|uniref:stage III sporulation protein AF n=1 Tax=Calidifontibacillus erzurumensis TaxID=2741433 RepID=UPI0035B52B89